MIGASACTRRSRTKAVPSMVSVPWVTTTPLAPGSLWTWISPARSIKSSRFSSEPGTCLRDVAETSATFAISGTSSTRSSPDNDGATPPLPVAVEEMVPPNEIMVTAGRVIEPPYCPATLSSGSSLNGEPNVVQRVGDSYFYTLERERPSVIGSAWYSTAGERRLRVKGRHDGGEAGPVLLNAVQHVI